MLALFTVLVVSGCGDDAPAPGPRDRLDAAADASAQDAALPDAAPPDAGRDGARDASLDAPDDAGEPGCQYRVVSERPGVFHTSTEAAPQHVERPLAPGEGVYCVRVAFTMQTADNLAEITDRFDGCPIFSHILGVRGAGPGGRVIGSAWFRFLRLDCSARRPGVVLFETFAATGDAAPSEPGPWLPGGTYRVTLTVEPFTSTLTLTDPATGAAVGPAFMATLEGATVDMTRDLRIDLGLDRVHDGAYFPYFGAVYSDLIVEADVAPPL